MRLILVRHGETDWVSEGRYQGSTDVPLNGRGIRQARALASFLKQERPARIYSSELTRAKETAKLIAKVSRKRVTVDGRLNEVSFGKWEGARHDEISVTDPRASRDWYRASWSSRPPGGESLRSLRARVLSFSEDLLAHSSDGSRPYVLVTHGGTIRMFLVQLLNVTPKIFWAVRVDPASVSVIHFGESRKELVLLNSQIHLNGLT